MLPSTEHATIYREKTKGRKSRRRNINRRDKRNIDDINTNWSRSIRIMDSSSSSSERMQQLKNPNRQIRIAEKMATMGYQKETMSALLFCCLSREFTTDVVATKPSVRKNQPRYCRPAVVDDDDRMEVDEILFPFYHEDYF